MPSMSDDICPHSPALGEQLVKRGLGREAAGVVASYIAMHAVCRIRQGRVFSASMIALVLFALCRTSLDAASTSALDALAPAFASGHPSALFVAVVLAIAIVLLIRLECVARSLDTQLRASLGSAQAGAVLGVARRLAPWNFVYGLALFKRRRPPVRRDRRSG